MHIRELAQRHKLSRTALLYYEKIGLLQASGRTEAGYRLYSVEDEARLRKICQYRETGLSLSAIAAILENEPNRLSEALQARLAELNLEISALREQQTLILDLLKQPQNLARAKNLNKAAWVRLLREAGYDEGDMWQWHIQFERQSPERHQKFLEMLNIPADEIRQIRALAGEQSPPADGSE